MNIVAFLLLVFGPIVAQATDLGKGRPHDYLHIHYPPDPVNTRNGNFYLPIPDYFQSCFGFPLEVYRSYNSFSTDDGPMGIGWSFNYDIHIVVGDQAVLRIVEPDGFINEYLPVEFASQDKGQIIKKIVEAKKQEDITYMKNKEGKGEAYYQDIETKLSKDQAYFERQKERYVPAPKTDSTSGKYVSHSRGTTYLTKTKKSYIRTMETGQTEEYDLDGNIIRIADRSNNEIRFFYDSKSQLEKVTDGCGNFLMLTYGPTGKIAKIRDSFSKEIHYTYKDGLLVSSKGIDQQVVEYGYDKFKRMNRILFKEDGTETSIQYDPKTSKVIAQIGPGKKRTTYEYSQTGNVFTTRVKDNQGENSLYEYDDQKNKIVQTDAKGFKTTTVLSDCCGKPILIETSSGVRDEFKYDTDHKLVERIDAQGRKTFFEYEPRFSMVSEIKDYTGETLRYRYNQQGNISFAKKTLADNSSTFVKIAYESHGKIEKIEDDKNQEMRFSYSAFGKPQSISLWVAGKKLAEIAADYGEDGTMVNRRYIPNNPETAQKIENTLRGYLLILQPAGIDFGI